MFIDISGFDLGWLSYLLYLPIFMYPYCPDFCKKCGKEIKGSSFWKFDLKLYCDRCRPNLTKEELAEEKKHMKSFRSLLRDVLPLLGRPLKKGEKPEDVASVLLIDAVVGSRLKKIKKGGE